MELKTDYYRDEFVSVHVSAGNNSILSNIYTKEEATRLFYDVSDLRRKLKKFIRDDRQGSETNE